MLIKGYPEGSNLTILNSVYHYAHKDDNGKLCKDSMTIVYKDNDTNEKKVETIYEPTYTYYKIKQEYVRTYPQAYIDKEKCDAITVPYKDLEKDIAERLNKKQFFYDNIRSGNRRANQLLHADPSLMSSDININNYYRKIFAQQYKNPTIEITKGYIDIEVDGKNAIGDFPEPGECPINAISLFNEVDKTLYTFVLRDSSNPLIAEFEEYITKNDFSKEFKDFLYDNVGGWKKAYRMHLDVFDIKVVFFDKEIDMLASMFNVINFTKPDFVLAWNMAFDIPYIIARIFTLGFDPRSILCNKDFPEQYCEYKIDQLHESEFGRRGDYADISSYSVFMDQMIQFASRRKATVFKSYGLDYIGNQVSGARKLDYHDITDDIVQFPYLNFRVFIMYNMMDVMVQKCIEEKTGDINYVFSKALVNDTMYHKAHRQTIYLANRVSKFILEHNNLIMGNNVNKFKERPEGKFGGAFVAPITNITDKPKEKINGKPIMLVRNTNDFDYKRLYPSIMQEFNICANGQIGRLFIDDKVHDKENPLHKEKYSRATSFIEDYASGDSISFCNRWFHYASFIEMIDDVKEYYSNHNSIRGLRTELSRGKKEVIREWYNNEKLPVMKLVDKDYKLPVINMYLNMPKDVEEKYKAILKEKTENGLQCDQQ